MQFKDRLKSLIDERGINQSDLARAIGSNRQSVSAWLMGRTRPREEQRNKLAEFFSVSPAWLFYGNQPGQFGDSAQLSSGTISIPLYDAPASCGSGATSDNYPELIRMVEVQPNWLQAYAPGASKGSLSMIPIIGDSMVPTLKEGDYVIIDSSQKTVSADALYAIDYANSRFVKRLQVKPDGFIVISDNPKYRPFEVPFDSDSIRIIGRAYAFLAFGKL